MNSGAPEGSPTHRDMRCIVGGLPDNRPEPTLCPVERSDNTRRLHELHLKNLMASPNASQGLESTESEEIGRENTDYIGAPINLTISIIRALCATSALPGVVASVAWQE